MIELLLPVLNRPQNAAKVVESIRAATIVPYRITFICSTGDDAEIEACRLTGETVIEVEGGDHEYARKINAGVIVTVADFVFLGADDLAFRPGWDRAAIHRFHATNKPVIGTNDLGNPSVMAGLHATHSLVHRSYIEQGSIDDPDRLLHEGYHHNWVDTEFIATAKHRDAFVFAADSVVEHLHPFWRKSADDEVYALGRRLYGQDRRLFDKRSALWR